jgi:hypothetical protein
MALELANYVITAALIKFRPPLYSTKEDVFTGELQDPQWKA